MKYRLKLYGGALGIGLLNAALLATPLPASADVLLSVDLSGNDCTGTLGTSPECSVNNSPQIVKFDSPTVGNSGQAEINSAQFPSIDGSEFKITFDNTQGFGTWEYTQGQDDPNVRYWSAKGGPAATVSFYVPDSETAAGGTCFSPGTTLDSLKASGCLDQALVVTSGDWLTPLNPHNNKHYGLSHITFFDTGGGGGGGGVPEPGYITLFGFGALLGVTAYRRRRAIKTTDNGQQVLAA